ncbi:MAG TPA: hypothetical protein VHW93_04190 [Acidimicrobiales bacterium]|nr:hypothetical protein [Acidimicrobiales bacterium]
MTSTATQRDRPSQLVLPLQSDPGRVDPVGDAWKLDEETRQIGRRGVAAARALLERSTGPADGRRPGHDRGPAGRAA